MSDVQTDKQRRSARLQLILIGAIAAFPILGSYILYQFWRPTSFVNHGELIAGAQMGVPRPGDPMGAALKAVEGKWVLAMVDTGACDEACRTKLYFLRQIRLTQGKEMERIERIWVVKDATTPAEKLLKDYDGTRIAMAVGSDWLSRFPAGNATSDYIYIIDPLGNVVMRYAPGFDPTGMKKDLMRLLRASRIG
jgi:hypothetical protein